MLIIIEKPGMLQKEVGEAMHMTPSTITRFLDKLGESGYIVREIQGRSVRIYPTAKGQKLETVIKEAWLSLKVRYSAIIGSENGDILSQQLGILSK